MTTLPDISGFGLIAWGIVIFLLLILATVIYLVVHSGVFEQIKVGAGKSKFPKLTLAYKYAMGPYSDCEELYTEMGKHAPPMSRLMGIYYDDPRETPETKTRYVVGAVLAEGDQTVSDDTKQQMLDKGYKLFTIPEAEHCVFTSFPYTTQLSIYLAVKRVYPALDAYIKEHRLCAHPMIEVYTPDKIQFFAPLSRQDDYYVPEVSPAEQGNDDTRDESGSRSDSSSGSGDDSSNVADDSLVCDSPDTSLVEQPAECDVIAETEVMTETEVVTQTEVVEDTKDPETRVTTEEIKTETETETEVDVKLEWSPVSDQAPSVSESGSDQNGSSASSFEDLAAEVRQMGKVPTENDIQEVQEE